MNCIIILSIIIIIITFYHFYNVKSVSKENFHENSPKNKENCNNVKFKNRNSFYNFLDNGLNNTSIVSIDSIETKRFPFIIENTTNYYNSDSPICTKN